MKMQVTLRLIPLNERDLELLHWHMRRVPADRCSNYIRLMVGTEIDETLTCRLYLRFPGLIYGTAP